MGTRLRVENGEGFKALLAEAGLNTNFDVLEQLDVGSDERVTWDKFYGKLKEAAKAEIRATGDVTAATEIKVDDDGTSTAATEEKIEVKIEDERTSKNYCCLCTPWEHARRSKQVGARFTSKEQTGDDIDVSK